MTNDFDDLDPLEAEQKRQKEAMDADARFAFELGQLSDNEFRRYLGMVNAAAERQPPKPYDGGPGSTKRVEEPGVELRKIQEDGTLGDVASNSDLIDYLHSIGVSGTRLELSLSEAMERERKRRGQ